jgi:phenylacetate-CoA ligase
MYKTLFQRYLYPFYETGVRRRKTLVYRDAMLERQWQSEEEIADFQWKHLKKLLDHAYLNAPYFTKLLTSLDLHPSDIKSYEDFRQIPVCSRDDIIANKETMIATNYRTNIIHKSTGGSTGVPMNFALDRDSSEWRTAAAQRGYSWAGCEPGQHVLYMWSVDIGDPGLTQRLKTDLYHSAFNHKMFNCFEFTEKEMWACLEYINKHRPTGIVAYTNTVYNFAKFVESRGLDCAPIESVITGAEKLFDHQREVIERVLCTRVFNTYGCREFMLIAAECEKHEGLHITADNLFIEVLVDGRPALPGERGEVVITDLHNFGMPFIRYRNGDMVIQGDAPCSCGRGLPLITDVDGRRLDEIVATDGRLISGVFFPHLMKEFPEVEKFQIIQKSITSLLVKIVSSAGFDGENLDSCRNEIKKVAGEGVNVEFEFVDIIPLTEL